MPPRCQIENSQAKLGALMPEADAKEDNGND
jgi:hypothetical protein